ncbi:MAG: hypothetical protein HUU01_08295 [Saprospiraceae bacterium]|nr:hypothetical protein [Saprospiraceae bacterium]
MFQRCFCPFALFLSFIALCLGFVALPFNGIKQAADGLVYCLRLGSITSTRGIEFFERSAVVLFFKQSVAFGHQGSVVAFLLRMQGAG